MNRQSITQAEPSLPVLVKDERGGAWLQLRSAIGPLILFVPGLFMTWWTWMKWPDPWLDYGAQLYLPWRITEGDVLYRDLQTIYGPFSAYFNAFVFHLFGVSLRTMVLANLTVMSAMLMMLYVMLREISDRFTATVAGLVFLLMFAFAQYLFIGNFNFATPYVEEIAHGALFAVASLFFLTRFLRKRRTAWLCICGLMVGLTVLTKPEVSVAAIVTCAIGLSMVLWNDATTGRDFLRAVAIFIASGIVPLLACTLMFRTHFGWRDSTLNTFNAWRYLYNPAVIRLPFFREMMGLDDVWGNLRSMCMTSGIYVLLLLPAALVARWTRQRRSTIRAQRIAAAFVFAITSACVWNLWDTNREPPIAQPFPIFMLIAIAISFRQWWLSRGREAENNHRWLALFLLALFAFILFGKILLQARIAHYGFVLAMPAALVLTVLLLEWIPHWIESRWRGTRLVARAGALGMIAACVAKAVLLSNHFYAAKTIAVGSGPDRFYCDFRGELANQLIAQIEQHTMPTDTLVVLPDHGMTNYICRRRLPTKYLTFAPPEFLTFGEDRLLAAFKAHPPDYVVLEHRRTSEFGFEFILRDYATQFAPWLSENYHQVLLIGSMPFQETTRYGVLVLKRNESGLH